MNLGEIKLDEQKVRDAAMDAAFQVAKAGALIAAEIDRIRMTQK